MMTKKNLILLGFVVAKFFLQYSLIHPLYDLHRDEYLHLDQANHLAWGYLSVPPLTSWISILIRWLGNDVFWVKFFPALFGALTLIVVWKAIEVLKGNLFALILGATCVLFSALLRLNTLFQPNSLDVLGWTTLYFVIIKYINTEKPQWLFTGAVVFAFGFLNKYNLIFLLIGFFPAILLSNQRHIFLKKEFYLAILLGLLLISPNLWWQYNHGFPVFHHLKELTDTQLVNVNRTDFLKEQLLFFMGGLLVLMTALYALLFYQPFQEYRLFFWAIVSTLAVFVFFKAKGYYAIGLYPIYFSFGSVFIAHLLAKGWKRYLQPIAIAIPLVLFVPLYQIAFPNKTPQQIIENPTRYKRLGLLRWEDGKDHALPQDFADMLGWSELAYKIDHLYEKLPNPAQTLILCDNYGQAGAINYYSKNKQVAAVSFNADYIHWFKLDKPIETFIRVKERKERNDEWMKTSPFFEKAVIADSITNPFAREYGTTIFVFSKPKINVNKRLQEEIDRKRVH
ncbi:MAG: glycosyltransferase family 39 protein [Spirosomataceae bacterium]